jgi:hypothetical protein
MLKTILTTAMLYWSGLVAAGDSAITATQEMVEDTWAGPFKIGGSGVTDCGQSRAQAEAWNLCSQKAMDASAITGVPVSVVDIRLENYWREDDEGPWWDHWRKCEFGADVYCKTRLAT